MSWTKIRTRVSLLTTRFGYRMTKRVLLVAYRTAKATTGNNRSPTWLRRLLRAVMVGSADQTLLRAPRRWSGLKLSGHTIRLGPYFPLFFPLSLAHVPCDSSSCPLTLLSSILVHLFRIGATVAPPSAVPFLASPLARSLPHKSTIHGSCTITTSRLAICRYRC